MGCKMSQKELKVEVDNLNQNNTRILTLLQDKKLCSITLVMKTLKSDSLLIFTELSAK